MNKTARQPAGIVFAPRPSNDFAEFIATYFERCRERVPEIEANAGKWTLEDLIPGLSDFDTRFLVNDRMTAADWCRMSTEVGKVHLELARERKDWARNLEHLPGVNLKLGEFLDPTTYFTEFSQWTFYHGDEGRLKQARQFVADHAWTPSDACYHWKKIAIFYGPYNRTIDPPINLGRFENKYSLHSRLMHYMAPPVHSAVCLMEKDTFPGKLDAFRKAQQLFPHPETIEKILGLVDRHYEEPRYLREPGITELDRELETYLTDAITALLGRDPPFVCPPRPTVTQLREAVRSLKESNPLVQLFENIKFSRLMKGRLWFYGQEVLWFNSPPMIRIELNRIRANFLEIPLRIYARVVYGREAGMEESLALMQGNVLDAEEIAVCRRFARLADPFCEDRDLKKRALEIAGMFDPFLCAIEKIMARAGRFKGHNPHLPHAHVSPASRAHD
jgi:hypothetical protein